jgi:hypothetical protein
LEECPEFRFEGPAVDATGPSDGCENEGGAVMQNQKMTPTRRRKRGYRKHNKERKNQRKAKKGRKEEEQMEKKRKERRKERTVRAAAAGKAGCDSRGSQKSAWLVKKRSKRSVLRVKLFGFVKCGRLKAAGMRLEVKDQNEEFIG